MLFRRLILLLALCALSSYSHCMAADGKMTEATSLYKKGEYKKALALLGQVTTSDRVRYMKGLCYLKQNQMTSAKQEFTHLYYKGTDKRIRYKAWQALRSIGKTQKRSTANSVASAPGKKGPGADAWVNPQAGYGRSGPQASSSVRKTIIPTSCSRYRH